MIISAIALWYANVIFRKKKCDSECDQIKKFNFFLDFLVKNDLLLLLTWRLDDTKITNYLQNLTVAILLPVALLLYLLESVPQNNAESTK
jgi:hypothetical protein